MKVIQILPELNSGGVERGTLEIAEYLVKTGHESIVISAGGKLVKKLASQGSRHIELPVHKKSLTSLKYISQIRQVFEKEHADIIHVRSRVPAWLTYLAWRKMPKDHRPRLVTTVHGFYSVNFYSAIMTKGEAVICVSNSVKNYVLKEYQKCPIDRLTVIHRGADPEEFRSGHLAPEESEASNLKKKLNTQFIVTLPGRVTHWKGQDDFITLISTLKKQGLPIHGLIAGGPHKRRQEFYQKLKQKVKDENLSSDITFLGDRNDLKDIMSISDAVISLSKDPEAFGRVTLEALSLGIPTLGYAHGGVKEQLETLYPSGLIEPHKLDHAASILTQWHRSGAAPIPETIAPFTRALMCEKTLEVYKNLSQDK